MELTAFAATIVPSAGAAFAAVAPKTPAVSAAMLPAAIAAASRFRVVEVRMPTIRRATGRTTGTSTGAARLRAFRSQASRWHDRPLWIQRRFGMYTGRVTRVGGLVR